ncbi:MAG: M48 family metallopeptidase [Nanoarchaeota archaeon]
MNFFKKNIEIEYPTTITINNVDYKIEVLHIKKKNSSVSLKEKKLIFRLSNSLNYNNQQKHFSQLLKKITLNISKKPQIEQINISNVLEKMFFMFANEKYNIKYVKYNKRIKLIDNTFYINPKIDSDTLDKNISKLLIYKYTKRIQKYIKKINQETYNFKINDITIKNLKSKWGHCTQNNSIMINLKLLNAPIEILNYVIIHELAHIKHKNHSQKYWLEVEKFCPNYKKLRKILKNSPPQLYK